VTDGFTVRKVTAAGQVSTIAGSSGTYGSSDGTGPAALFSGAEGVAVDTSGNLYVADRGNHTIRFINPAGQVSTLAGKPNEAGNKNGSASDARFFEPVAVTLDSSGNLYVAEAGNYAVRKGSRLNSGLPVITSQPSSVAIASGSAATFSVTATNATSYQWYFNDAPVVGATSATFTIGTVNAPNVGTYRVAVTGAGGVVQSESVTLSIRDSASLKLVNISTRAYVGTGENVLIAGMVIRGSGPKKVLIRAAGPALGIFNLGGLLADPTLSLMSGAQEIASNDDWSSDATKKAVLLQAMQQTGAFSWVEGSRDAALLVTLNPGEYTAIVRGKNDTTGIALVEAYAVDAATGTSEFINLSTRSVVKKDAEVQIAGFVLQGDASLEVLIRALGPTLRNYGLTNTLTDPTIELYQGDKLLLTNDDYGAQAALHFASFGLGAPQSAEPAIYLLLNAGAYTAIVKGKGADVGTALIEVYSK
jgi:hypothetical protein